MQRISSFDDIERGLDALIALDPRLAQVRQSSGEVPLRLQQPGFASLASIIVSQQVSRASADAIFGRLTRLVDPLTPERLLAAGAGGVPRGRPVAVQGGRPGGGGPGDGRGARPGAALRRSRRGRRSPR